MQERKNELKLEKIINGIANNDPELYSRLVDRLNNNIYSIIKEEKEKICLDRDYHDFSEWKKEIVNEECYSDIWETSFTKPVNYYKRKCLYCGYEQETNNKDMINSLTEKNEKSKTLYLKRK